MEFLFHDIKGIYFFLKKLITLTASYSNVKEVIAMEPKRTEYSIDYLDFLYHSFDKIFAHVYP